MELKEQFIEITHLIVTAKNNAYRAVNKELVNLYWQIGAYLSNKVKQDEWGKSVVKELAKFIQQTEPSIRGFSSQNLWRMKQFYETYQDNSKLSTLSRVFPEELSQTFKDTYVLELLQLPENHLEKDLRKAISQNITHFLLEFGRDFAFMGEEYPIQVGNQDFAIDLMFYNRSLGCMVAIELKIEKFKPEHLGQLNFYLEALDRDVKKEHEKPSIGILLCKDKDDTVVEYALSRNLSPTLVADYRTKMPDKALLQKKWEEIIATLNLEEE